MKKQQEQNRSALLDLHPIILYLCYMCEIYVLGKKKKLEVILSIFRIRTYLNLSSMK